MHVICLGKVLWGETHACDYSQVQLLAKLVISYICTWCQLIRTYSMTRKTSYSIVASCSQTCHWQCSPHMQLTNDSFV